MSECGLGRGGVVGARAVGEQPIVADAVEALGQDMIRNRRMNSCVWSVIVLNRSRPSNR
jgi:hypothetical protein